LKRSASALALRAAGVARHALNEAASALGVKDGLRGRDAVRGRGRVRA
jgi:hypothetical protein